ncbi:MAG TPA: hypothetical protein VFO79_15165 [Xanthomonadales bacterium]|nr:hypothetical protein [Xanthomonadales bacterium]
MRARLRPALAAACLTLALGSAAEAATTGYAVGFDTLFRIELTTGKATRIGTFGTYGASDALIADVEGISFAPDGTLYGVSDSQKLLVRIDPATAAATPVGLLREGEQLIASPTESLDFGLAFTCDGRMWLSSDSRSKLWEVDPRSGQVRFVGETGARISGLAARGNQMLGIGVEGDSGLYRIDLESGRATLMARLVPSASFLDAGLDFDADGQLWAARNLQGQTSDLVRIDIDNGMTRDVSRVTFAAGVTDKEIETLAIAAPGGCTGGTPIGPPQGLSPDPRAVPAASTGALALLGALLALVAGLTLRRRSAR